MFTETTSTFFNYIFLKIFSDVLPLNVAVYIFAKSSLIVLSGMYCSVGLYITANWNLLTNIHIPDSKHIFILILRCRMVYFQEKIS